MPSRNRAASGGGARRKPQGGKSRVDEHPRESAAPLSEADRADLEERLLRLRALLSGDVVRLERDAQDLSANRRDSESEEELTLSLLARDTGTLEEIQEALRRVADGSYGSCESCETGIPHERLMAIPYARRCVPCESRHAAQESARQHRAFGA